MLTPLQSGAAVRSQQKTLRPVGLLGTGSCVPDRVLTNRDLEQLVETSDDWIMARTGVRERRLVRPGQSTSHLATVAGRQALEASGLTAEELGLIIIATVTPDHICPPTACLVQHELGAYQAAGFDLSAACSGFANALLVGHDLVAAGTFGNALVIGADVLSSITDYEDRATCILFGDGAGAVVLAPGTERRQIIDQIVGIDGRGADLITVPAGGSSLPATRDTVDRREHYLRLDGRKVFKFAVKRMCGLVEEITRRNDLAIEDIDLLIPHQANMRILDAAVDKLGVPMDRVMVNVDRYGNTSSASIPVALDEAVRGGRLQQGDLVCTVAFGGGLSWGASLIRW